MTFSRGQVSVEKKKSTENDARKRWTKLRDYFRKTHGEKTYQKSGSAGRKRKKWYLYDNMLFVLPHLLDRKTESNISESDNEDTEHMIQVEEASQASSSSFVFAPINSPSQSPHVSTPTPVDASSQDDQPRVNAPHTRPQTKRSVRRPPYPQERHDIHLDVEMIQTLKGLSQKQEDTNNDEDLIFFKSLLPKMKLLNPDEKMECQYEMHTLMMRYVRNHKVNSSSSRAPPEMLASPQPGTQLAKDQLRIVQLIIISSVFLTIINIDIMGLL
ncbi:hypothetical protein RRG08_042200 [Elysia crispata]|uniref:BESS domain-containing protein n=1 Tax=Elysia crispata TaxID=231223 RepID=A0AAE1BE69_9GAST|nr:hypothetical protein RRG08_042200 [Elysia crispata]